MIELSRHEVVDLIDTLKDTEQRLVSRHNDRSRANWLFQRRMILQRKLEAFDAGPSPAPKKKRAKKSTIRKQPVSEPQVGKINAEGIF